MSQGCIFNSTVTEEDTMERNSLLERKLVSLHYGGNICWVLTGIAMLYVMHEVAQVLSILIMDSEMGVALMQPMVAIGTTMVILKLIKALDSTLSMIRMPPIIRFILMRSYRYRVEYTSRIVRNHQDSKVLRIIEPNGSEIDLATEVQSLLSTLPAPRGK